MPLVTFNRLLQRIARNNYLAICFSLSLCVCTTEAFASDGNDLVERLLQRCEAALAMPERIRFRAIEQVTETLIERDVKQVPTTTAAQAVVDEIYEMYFRKDGHRLDISQESKPAGASRKAVYVARAVYDTDCLIYDISGQNQIVIKGKNPGAVNRVKWYLQYGRALEGFIITSGKGVESVFDLIRSGRNHQVRREEAPDGSALHVVSADTTYGTHTLWLNESRDYLPHRIEVIKGPDDVLHGKPVRARGLIKHLTVADAFIAKDIGGRIIPVAVNVEITETPADGGEVRQIRASHRRTDVDLNPTFDGTDAFVLGAPEGTNAMVEGDQSGLIYEWRDGRVVPAAQAGIARAIDGTIKHAEPFPRTRKTQWAWAGALIISLCAAAALIYWALRSRKTMHVK